MVRYLFSIFLPISFLILIITDCTNEVDLTDDLSILKNKNIFSHVHLDKKRAISYKIKSREALNRNNIHRVYFYIEIPNGVTQDMLKAVAQKIVKNTITHEICHSINIDFGPYGYIDFAPFGEWVKAGDVPIENYRYYRFKYCFSSLPSTD